jgi:hypothetical protein
MCKRAICLLCCLWMLGSARVTLGELVGHWKLDEGIGTKIADSSGKGNEGTVAAGNPTWIAGVQGAALEFHGLGAAGGGGDYISINSNATLDIGGPISIALWIRPDADDPEGQATTTAPMAKAMSTMSPSWSYQVRYGWGGAPQPYMAFTFNTSPRAWAFVGGKLARYEWCHIACTYDGATLTCFVDGVQTDATPMGPITKSDTPVLIGSDGWGCDWIGAIDDVRIYNHPLTMAELKAIITGPATLAATPDPADEATDVAQDSSLSWTPGLYAVTHDVYLGKDFVDVNTATRTSAGLLVSEGQSATTYAPSPLLDFGTTYYWRIDEVNKPSDNVTFKGTVWSFTTEPYGYPVKPVKATASSFQPNMGPDKTIDGSGLTGDLHGTEATTMWLSAGAQPNWIQYEFDQSYKLHDLKVWNSNQLVEAFLGFGAKKVTIETSLDGATWTPVADVPEFSRAPGTQGYAANTTVNLGDVEAKYVKLTIDATWGGVAPQTGLAEVRFSYVPLQARLPMPADGAAQVGLDTELNWRPGREATSHAVSFGTDSDAVTQGTAPTKTVTEHSYLPAALNFGTTYYWKVNEVGAVTYPGDVWSFTTQEYAVIDDFESYTDQAGEEVFSAWIDGFTNGLSGSTVGYMTAVAGTFGETRIVHGGKQSMPLLYDNTAAPFVSEAERTFDTAQNWATNGADSLVIYFRGLAPASASQPEGNSAEGLYLVVKDSSGKTKVVQHPAPAATTSTSWQTWMIPLSEFTSAGVKMNAVKSLAVGVGNKAAPKVGGTGTVYIDDIGYGKPAK